MANYFVHEIDFSIQKVIAIYHTIIISYNDYNKTQYKTYYIIIIYKINKTNRSAIDLLDNPSIVYIKLSKIYFLLNTKKNLTKFNNQNIIKTNTGLLK